MTLKNTLWKCLCEDICSLVLCRAIFDLHYIITDEFSNIVIIDINVFVPLTNLVVLCHFNIALIVLQNLQNGGSFSL